VQATQHHHPHQYPHGNKANAVEKGLKGKKTIFWQKKT
jgi:hypothetical protein